MERVAAAAAASGLPEAAGKIRQFFFFLSIFSFFLPFRRGPRGRQTSQPIFNLLWRAPVVCLSAFFSEFKVIPEAEPLVVWFYRGLLPRPRRNLLGI